MLIGRNEGRLVAAVAHATDRGWVRETNEDSAAAVRLPGPVASPWVWVAAVADGIGGNAAGEVASRGAVDAFILTVQSLLADGIADPAQLTERGFAEANAEIGARAQSVPENSTMGTTLTTALLWGRRLWVGHVGDSRLYVVRRGQARQVTRDHSVRGMLTRHLSIGSAQAPDIAYVDLRDGDVAVLCTDGLYRRLLEQGIAGVIRASDNVCTACANLVAAAKERDGADNITAACIAIGRRAFRKPVSLRRRSIAVLLLAVLVAMGVVIWELAKPRTGEKQATEAGTGGGEARSDAVRVEIKIQGGRLEISQGWTGVRIARPTGVDGGGRADATAVHLADQKVTMSLAPDAGTRRMQLTFDRVGKQPLVLGYRVDGGGLIRSSRTVIGRPKESISFNLAGADGGADIPVQILLGSEIPGHTAEAADVHGGTTKSAAAKPPNGHAGRRDQRARATGPRLPSARARARRGAAVRSTGAIAGPTDESPSASERADGSGRSGTDAK